MFRTLAATCAALLLSACTSSITYRADYLPEIAIPPEARIDGRVLVYTTRADDERVESEGATSFTGSGATLVTPVGLITREVAVKVFSAAATEGAVHSNELTDLGRYSVVVRPEIQDFSYGFPQLKNLGFAITPEAQVKLRMTVLDAEGRAVLEKDYDSGVVEGKSYMMSGKPYERVSKLLHDSLYDLMLKAAADVRGHQQAATVARPAD